MLKTVPTLSIIKTLFFEKRKNTIFTANTAIFYKNRSFRAKRGIHILSKFPSVIERSRNVKMVVGLPTVYFLVFRHSELVLSFRAKRRIHILSKFPSVIERSRNVKMVVGLPTVYFLLSFGISSKQKQPKRQTKNKKI